LMPLLKVTNSSAGYALSGNVLPGSPGSKIMLA
jgi:hypothetical protein